MVAEKRGNAKEFNIYGFGEWARYFHTPMVIRLEYAPVELQGMLRHCKIVQYLFTQGRDSIQYDVHFRRGKEQHPSILRGKYLPDLVLSIPSIGMVDPRPSWLRASNTYSIRVMPTYSFPLVRPNRYCNNFPSQPSSSLVVRGYCFRYNSLSGWSTSDVDGLISVEDAVDRVILLVDALQKYKNELTGTC